MELLLEPQYDTEPLSIISISICTILLNWTTEENIILYKSKFQGIHIRRIVCAMYWFK